jgi:nitrate/nitrite transporter NarK
MYLGNSYAFYFCITWLPTYLEERHGVSRQMLGVYAGLPLTLSVIGDFFGGITTDRLCRRFGLRIGRCGLGLIAYVFAAGAMMFAATAKHPGIAIAALSLSVAAVMFTLGATWGTCLDIGGRHAGVVSGVMNTAGNTGAIFSPIIAVWAKNHLGGWDAPLWVIAGIFCVGAVCWGLIDPEERVFD